MGAAVVWILISLATIASVLADIFQTVPPSLFPGNQTFMGGNIALKDQLFAQYRSEERPVRDSVTRTNVTVSVVVSHLESIDELQQRMRVHGYMTMTWTDQFLTWDSAASGQDYIDTTQWHVWKPDVHIFNSASGKDDVYVISWRVPIRIFANGQVILWTPVIFDVTCLFDFTDFPYDRQSCSVSFGSIVYPTNKVDYKWAKKSPVTLRLAYQSDKRHLSGWEIQSATASKMYLNEGGRVNQSSNSTTEWAELLFRIDMQRHSPYFNLLFVSPALVAALLTLFSMFLRNAEVAATVLLRNLVIQALFLRGLITILPLSIGNSPKIVIFYGFNIGMTIVAAVLVILRSLIDVTADKPFHPRVTSVNKWVNERFSWLFLTKTQPDTTRSQLDQTVYISFAAIYLISYIVAILSLFV